MFESLTGKLDSIFKKLKGRGRLDEESISAAMKDIRMALLEADVNFKVVKSFTEDIKSRAVGHGDTGKYHSRPAGCENCP